MYITYPLTLNIASYGRSEYQAFVRRSIENLLYIVELYNVKGSMAIPNELVHT